MMKRIILISVLFIVAFVGDMKAQTITDDISNKVESSIEDVSLKHNLVSASLGMMHNTIDLALEMKYSHYFSYKSNGMVLGYGATLFVYLYEDICPAAHMFAGWRTVINPNHYIEFMLGAQVGYSVGAQVLVGSNAQFIMTSNKFAYGISFDINTISWGHGLSLVLGYRF